VQPADPCPPPEGLLAPKQLATVILSPTPVATLVVPPTATRQPSATPSPIPPTPTATQTPYIGVFMGDGSLPLVMPTSPYVPLVDVTLIPPTPLGGENAVVFATATPIFAQPYGTLDPALGGASITGCATQLAGVFGGPYAANPGVAQALGCPTGAPEQPSMAEQSFERGLMIWMPGQIYALATEVVDGQSRCLLAAARPVAGRHAGRRSADDRAADRQQPVRASPWPGGPASGAQRAGLGGPFQRRLHRHAPAL
jgi:hypothetical protein